MGLGLGMGLLDQRAAEGVAARQGGTEPLHE